MSKHQFICIGGFILTIALFFGWSTSLHAEKAVSLKPPSVQNVTDPEIPVALTPGGVKKYVIASTLSLPSSRTKTVIVTYHGSTYGQYYWDFPYKPGTYSFVDAMTKAGFAVLNIDRIGDGHSSHPASDLVTMASDSYTLHQIVQDLREGEIDHVDFPKVVLATHSLGGYISWYAAAMYPQDFDGIIETGAIHHNSTTRDTIAIPLSYPAVNDAKFKNSGLDHGYYTTIPNTRAEIYYHTVSTSDPTVAKIDEQLKQTRVQNELIAGIDLASTHVSTMIHVPVLTVLGQDDFFACAPDGMNCSTAQTIKQAEAPFYAPDACLQAYDLAGAGHDINLAPNAHVWYAHAVTWINSFVEHQQPGCGRRPQSVPLQQIATITISGTPASNWCYDAATVDKGTYYLADDDRNAIDVIQDTQHPVLTKTIGPGTFTGPGGCKAYNYDAQGPNGVVVAHDQIFASNGNSSVKVYSSVTGQFITDIATHGHLRADEMTYDPHNQWVVVANGAERDFSKQAAPFLSFISTKTGKSMDHVVKTLRFPHAAGLEQPLWNPYDGKLYLSVTSSDQNKGGEVDVIDPTTFKVTQIVTPNCGDAGLAVATRAIMAVGCGDGMQIVLNVQTHHIIRIPVTSVDIIAATNHFLYYASYGSETQAPQLAVADLQGHLLQTIPIAAASHTVTVNPENGHVFVPLDGGQVAIFQQNQRFSEFRL
ncbi:MAG: alpha/beta fold hydrolase [Ktedonobacteraceae bacterium]|nr:alpha/beta fold hydrolase [Ktedonobacteraceae bacterium]